MSLFDWMKPIDRAIGVIGEYVEDKDKANQLTADLETLKHSVGERLHIAELNVTTHPLIDGLHKMSRTISSWIGYGLAFYMVHEGYDAMAAMAAIAPGGIYNYIKGKGK